MSVGRERTEDGLPPLAAYSNREIHDKAVDNGTLYSDEELARRAVRTAAHRATRATPAWAQVSIAIGCGSAVAQGLCRRFGVDPDSGGDANAATPAPAAWDTQTR